MDFISYTENYCNGQLSFPPNKISVNLHPLYLHFCLISFPKCLPIAMCLDKLVAFFIIKIFQSKNNVNISTSQLASKLHWVNCHCMNCNNNNIVLVLSFLPISNCITEEYFRWIQVNLTCQMLGLASSVTTELLRKECS